MFSSPNILAIFFFKFSQLLPGSQNYPYTETSLQNISKFTFLLLSFLVLILQKTWRGRLDYNTPRSINVYQFIFYIFNNLIKSPLFVEQLIGTLRQHRPVPTPQFLQSFFEVATNFSCHFRFHLWVLINYEYQNIVHRPKLNETPISVMGSVGVLRLFRTTYSPT